MQPSPLKTHPQQPNKLSFTDTFGSSLSDEQEKYQLDRNLARSILQNKPQLIVDDHKESALVEEAAFDQQLQISKIAIEYRNKYDRTKNQSNALESRINILKQQISRLETSSNQLLASKRQTAEKYNNMQKQLQIQTQMVSQTEMRLDGSRHMSDRLQKDITFYRKKQYDSNIQLIKLRSQKRRFGDHSHRQQKLSIRCKTLLDSVQVKLNHNQHQRKRGLYDINNILGSKNELHIKQNQREHRLQKSMMSALSEKLPEQRQLVKLFLVNKFLKSLLRTKMDHLMATGKDLNDSFCTIKQHTTVRSVQQFVKKFMKKEEVYGSLLEAVALSQPKIQLLKKQTEQLKEERRLIEHQRDQTDEKYKKIHKNNLEPKIQEVQRIEEKLQQIQKFKNGLLNWSVGTLAMLRGQPRPEIRSRYSYLADIITDCLRLLSKTCEGAQQKETSIAEDVLSRQIQKNKLQASQYLRRNVRVKTLGNEVKQEQDNEYDLLSQKDYLHGARRAVKKRQPVRERDRLLSRY